MFVVALVADQIASKMCVRLQNGRRVLYGWWYVPTCGIENRREGDRDNPRTWKKALFIGERRGGNDEEIKIERWNGWNGIRSTAMRWIQNKERSSLGCHLLLSRWQKWLYCLYVLFGKMDIATHKIVYKSHIKCAIAISAEPRIEKETINWQRNYVCLYVNVKVYVTWHIRCDVRLFSLSPNCELAIRR